MRRNTQLNEVEIVSMSPEGRGIAKINGKTIFVSNALPGEIVNIEITKKRKSYDEAFSTEILKSVSDRIQPGCQHFTVCGGCSMQHLSPARQIEYKQDFLFGHIQQLAATQPENILPPLQAETWHYRRKARLGVKFVKKKQRVLVGFREKSSGLLADISQCEVLHKNIGYKLEVLAEFILSLDSYQSIPQIEIAVTNDHTALIVRHLEPLSESDINALTQFAIKQNLVIYLQSKGPDSIKLLHPDDVVLEYDLPEYQLSYTFGPSDFTQVNYELNEKLVTRALALLCLSDQDTVLDLFCGIGNFTLAIAKYAKSVVGVEGSAELIKRARSNAAQNNITNVQFYTTDLSKPVEDEVWFNKKTYSSLLLDPPRSGAKEFIESIAKLDIKKIVYVSCNPATLARDISMLAKFDYKLISAGVLDMFPHTSHVESIALLQKK